MTTNPLHSSESNEHYSPVEYIEAARELFGGEITLDPASTQEVNEKTVKASSFFSKENDGFTQEWHGNVWLNPPGGLIGRRSSMLMWWSKLVDEYEAGRVKQALFLGFNLEIIRTSQNEPAKKSLIDFPICIPKSRIKFLNTKFEEQKQPTHPNIIAYLPLNDGSCKNFHSIFNKFGGIISPK